MTVDSALTDPDRAARKRQLARERQRRCRARRNRGNRFVLLPPEIADELGDEEHLTDRVIAILRRHLAGTA